MIHICLFKPRDPDTRHNIISKIMVGNPRWDFTDFYLLGRCCGGPPLPAALVVPGPPPADPGPPGLIEFHELGAGEERWTGGKVSVAETFHKDKIVDKISLSGYL